MRIKVLSRSGKDLAQLDLKSNATLNDLKEAFAGVKKVAVERQYFTMHTTDGSKGEALKDGVLTLYDGATIVFKDLGPQISWTTVFLIEYFGPMMAFPLFYVLRPYVYGVASIAPLHETQWIAMALFVFHFAKRELETLFVHKFSNGTMPLFNLFKNSGYYWLNAFYTAYYVMHPLFTSPQQTLVYVFAALFVVCELSNFYCHLILSNLRPPGTKERRIPRGFLFEFVSCANYTFEIAAWVCFTIMVQSLAALLFTLIGAGQMAVWAIGKHKRYRKEFPDYPRKRKILIPFLW